MKNFGILIFPFITVFGGNQLMADHGPSTNGGSIQTYTAETLEKGKYTLLFSSIFTDFEDVSGSDFESKARSIDGDDQHFDTLEWSLLETVSLSYGATDSLELTASTGWYRGDDLREGHIEDSGGFEHHEFGDISGQTDLWLKGKYQIWSGKHSVFSILGGLKLPTGDDDKRGDGSASRLEPTLQPGTGTFDLAAGAAFSAELVHHYKVNFSILYTLRTQNDHFEIGDTLDIGVGFNYTTPNHKTIFLAEVNYQLITKSSEDGEDIENSGGTRVFLSPGVRHKLSDSISVALSPQFPVSQNMNDKQQEMRFKLSLTISIDL